MRNLNHTMDRLVNRWWKLPILVLLLVVLGIFFSPAESAAQAVPPRGQGLQMIRPLVPPPEPPVEKEIRETRQELEAAKAELARKIDLEKTIRSLRARKDMFQNELIALIQNPDKDEKVQEIKGEMRDERCVKLFERFLNYMKITRGKELDTLLRNPHDDKEAKKVKRDMGDKRCIGLFNRFLNYANSLLVQFESHNNRLYLIERRNQ